MLRIGSYVKVADNTGAMLAQIIGIYGGSGTRSVGVARVVKVTIKKARADGSVKEHEMHRAVIVRVKKPYRREDGSYIRFDDNAVVILDGDTKFPKGTRIFGPIARELKAYGFDKITQLAEEVL